MGYNPDPLKRLCVDGEYVSGKGTLYRQVWSHSGVGPSAVSITNVHAAITQPASGTTRVTTGITQPDFPRTVRIDGSQATCAGDVLIEGRDQFGAVVSESLTANGTATVEGVQVFVRIIAITVPVRGAGGDAISVGCGAGLGLDRHVSEDSGLYAIFDGVREATLPTISTVRSTAEFDSSLDGSSCVFAYVHVDLASA